jgi:hypothetical protein
VNRSTPLVLCAGLLLGAASCQSEQAVELPSCPPHSAEAPASVAGTFRYTSRLLQLAGTIRFEQIEDRLIVTDTTYDRERARALEGEGLMDGNRATVVLVPKNGDVDYTATVTLAFSSDGNEFCLVEFSDTNDDRGGEGIYTGVRQ